MSDRNDYIVLVDKKTRSELKVGDDVKDFRGDEWKLVQIYPPGTSGGGLSGKVLLKDDKGRERYFFCSVIDAEFAILRRHLDAPLTEDETPKTRFDRTMAKEKGYDE